MYKYFYFFLFTVIETNYNRGVVSWIYCLDFNETLFNCYRWMLIETSEAVMSVISLFSFLHVKRLLHCNSPIVKSNFNELMWKCIKTYGTTYGATYGNAKNVWDAITNHRYENDTLKKLKSGPLIHERSWPAVPNSVSLTIGFEVHVSRSSR